MLGIVGLGFMGMTHFEAARAARGVSVAAFATSSAKKRAGDWSSIQGNFGPRGSKTADLAGAAAYATPEELLADDRVTLVSVCTPTASHADVAVAAMRAGKHVLVEKPIALTLKDADRMLREADKAGVRLLVGHVLPFFAEFRWLRETIAEGRYGRVRAAHFKRVMCPPDWLGPDGFERVGGWGVDLHCHDTHLISLLFGTPAKASATGLLRGGLTEHVSAQYHWGRESAPAVSCVSGGVAAGGLKFHHGFEVHLEKATLQFDAGTYGSEWVVNRPPTLVDKTDRVRTPKLKGGTEWYSPFQAEIELAAKAVRTGADCPELDARLARDAVAVVQAEAKSIETGRPAAVK